MPYCYQATLINNNILETNTMNKFLYSALVAVMLIALSPLANAATAWTADTTNAQPGTVKIWTSSITNLVTETAVLTGLDLCSEIIIGIDATVAVSPTITVASIAGGISATPIIADVIAAGGSQTAVNYGIEAIMVEAAGNPSPSTVNLVLKEYRYKNCKTKSNM